MGTVKILYVLLILLQWTKSFRWAPSRGCYSRGATSILCSTNELDSLNPSQRAAATSPLTNVRVIAGPGSGKTRVLVHRIAFLLASGVPARSILAVTFTKKAALQMRTRLNMLVPENTARNVRVLTLQFALSAFAATAKATISQSMTRAIPVKSSKQ